MEIRTASMTDLKEVSSVEAECFPAAEAATEESFRDRLTFYPGHFLLLLEEGKLAAFIDGMVTDKKDLTDDMYENASMHQEDGAWQMIFGLNTRPACRRRGLAGTLIRAFQQKAQEEGRQGVVLTCKDALVHYYSKFGFIDEGVSASTHGGVRWHQMRWLAGAAGKAGKI